MASRITTSFIKKATTKSTIVALLFILLPISAVIAATYSSGTYNAGYYNTGASPADTVKPTISITAPSANASISGSAVTLSATATDNVGVAGVQFKLDGANIGSEDTTSPYSISWNSTTATDGNHTITAVARDAASNTATSTGVAINIDNNPPTRSNGAPSGSLNAGTTSTTISLTTNETATCKYTTAVNTAYASMTNSMTAGTSNFHSATVSGLTNGGTYNYYVRCSDTRGNANTNDYAISFGVNTPANTAPRVNAGTDKSITLPTTSTTLTGSATDDDGSISSYQWTVVSAPTGASPSISSPTSASTNVTGLSVVGSYVFKLTAKDNLLAVGADDVSVIVSNVVDTTAPTVSITAPTANSTVAGDLTISATATDNVGVAGVQFKLDGGNLGNEDTSSPFSIVWNSANATDGTHTITATARDAAGNTTTSSAVTITIKNTVVVDTTAPTVSITTPSNNSVVGGTVAVTATATDNVGVVGVQFKLDGNNLGSEDLTSPYTVSWTTANGTQGTHTITAIARDAANNTKTSSAVSVTVDNTAPVITTLSPGSSLPAGTTSTTLSVSTNETAACRYNNTDIAYSSMTKNLATSNGTTHTAVLTGLVDSTSYSYYVRCSDGVNNVNSSGQLVSFSVQTPVATDTTAPSISSGSPSGTLAAGTTSDTLSVSTDEVAVCRYSTSAGVSYASMTGVFSSTNSTQHQTTISGLSDGTSYNYYVRCIDDSNNATTSDYEVTFAVGESDSGGGGGGGSSSPTIYISAGADQDVFLPTTTMLLTGTAAVSDDTIQSVQWTQRKGPENVTILSPYSYSTSVSGLTKQGNYEFRFTATTEKGYQNSDTIEVHVKPAGSVVSTGNNGNGGGGKVKTTATVTATQLNVRSEPTASSTLLGQTSLGEQGEVYPESEVNGWVKVRFTSGVEGYVSKKYVTITQTIDTSGTTFTPSTPSTGTTTATATVNTALLNVRSMPTASSALLGQVTLGMTGSVVPGTDANGWVQVQFTNGVTGYVSKKYVSVSGGTVTPTPTYQPTTNSVVVNTALLNVRSTPGVTGALVGQAQMGDTGTVIATASNGWVQVQFTKGIVGYVANKYLTYSQTTVPTQPVQTPVVQVPQASTVTVNTALLNVRSAPINGPVVGTVTMGTLGTVLERQTYWIKVQFPTVTGWVYYNKVQ
jgi:uncharacterized protein YgiM (DUF1202 family)